MGYGMYGGAVAVQTPVLPWVEYMYVDNYYVKILTENGIVGVTAFGMMLLGLVGNGLRACVRTAKTRWSPLCAGMLCGLIGVAYAVILILFLKDPSKAPADTALAKKPSKPEEKTVLLNVDNDEQVIKEPASKLSTGAVLSSLLSGRPMWMLLAVVAFAGAGNWFLLTWYPTLLQDKYQLSSAEAGPAATLWSSVAKYIAVLGGAILADMWYKRNARARALVPGITFTISGPLEVLALLSGSVGGDCTVALVLLRGLVATQGLAQGSLDATLMPVLRSHIDERYSATGYGLLNLTSAGVGALISFFGGWFKDQGVPLTTTQAAAGCLMLICGLLLLLQPRPNP